MGAAHILWLLIPACSGLNVLVLHPLYAGSHVLTLQAVTEELLSRGHQVTTVKFKDEALPPLRTIGHENFTLIERSVNNSMGNLPFITEGEQAQFRLPLELIWGQGQSIQWTIRMMISAQAPQLLKTVYCSQLLGEDLGLTLSEYNSTFHIAIVDLMFNECGLALAHRLGIPSLGYWAFSFSAGWQEYTTQPAPPSYVPAFMTGLGSRMNLLERTLNMAARIAEHMFMVYYHSVVDKIIYKISPSTPPSHTLIANLSGMLLNTDMVLDYPRPQPPTFINIGGIQIKDNPGPLPDNIRLFMEGAKEGVVLFTMGFIFDSVAVPKSMIVNLLTAFSKLPQKVIFKYDIREEIVGKKSDLTVPPNVLILPWVPQQVILAHPATKVFITHCGMHGVLEAIYHQVPMVGMPVFIDQTDVLTRMVEQGIGLGVDKSAQAENIYKAIVKVRDDPSYKQNIRSLSQLMKDRRSTPMEDAVWLVEYLARTGGASHLKVNSRHLGFLEYYSVDSILLLLCLVVTILTLIYQCVPRILRNCFSSTKVKML